MTQTTQIMDCTQATVVIVPELGPWFIPVLWNFKRTADVIHMLSRTRVSRMSTLWILLKSQLDYQLEKGSDSLTSDTP